MLSATTECYSESELIDGCDEDESSASLRDGVEELGRTRRPKMKRPNSLRFDERTTSSDVRQRHRTSEDFYEQRNRHRVRLLVTEQDSCGSHKAGHGSNRSSQLFSGAIYGANKRGLAGPALHHRRNAPLAKPTFVALLSDRFTPDDGWHL